jgi:prepilin-type N-terminal cleavage/methylation domain-containing protein
MSKRLHNDYGFTLIEVLVAIAVSGFVIIGLGQLFSASIFSYSLQDQLTEMNQNAKFTLKELSDVLQQAGANCELINSDSLDKDTIIRITTTGATCTLSVKINPRGGIYQIPMQTVLNTTVKCSLMVLNGYSFLYADKLGKLPNSSTSNTRSVKIYSLDSVNISKNIVFFHGGSSIKDTFLSGDGVYSFMVNKYYLKGDSLCLNNDTNVIAENIDSLKVIFYKNDGSTITTDWKTMWSTKITVRARTSISDPKYNEYSDHRHRLLLTYSLRLKNKV